MSREPLTSNHLTAAQLDTLPLGEIASLPVGQLMLLQEEMTELKARTRHLDELLNAALALRFGDRAQAQRRAQGKDTGTIRLDDEDGIVVVCDLPKKADYDQEKLRAAVQTIQSWGSDPREYVTTEIKVSEMKYSAWPSEIRALFEPARTVKFGKPTYRLERRKE